jgi:hypothetical protein
MNVSSNISDFDKVLNNYSKTLKNLGKTSIDDDKFKLALKEGADYLASILSSEFKKADPTGDSSGKVQIKIGAFPSKKKDRDRFKFIIGPNYKTSKGWQVWHLLNYGFVHALGSVTKAGKKRTKAASTTTIVPGKKFLQSAMMRGGIKSAEIAGKRINKFLEEKIKKVDG